MLESDYILLPEPVSLMSVTPISIMDSTDITNHIVRYFSKLLLGGLWNTSFDLLFSSSAKSKIFKRIIAYRHSSTGKTN